MAVDSRLFASADSYTELGAQRNAVQFWKLWEQKYPGALSEENLIRVKSRRVPRGDTQWVEHFPEHQHYIGEKLEHHHVDHTFPAVPLPKSLHRGAGNKQYWHKK